MEDQEKHYRRIKFPHELIIPINHNSEISVRFVQDSSMKPSYSRMDMRVQSTRSRKSETQKLVLKNCPLSVSCQKAIVENMYPSFRLYLSQKNPAFAPLEREVPMKIEHLSLSPSMITIDWESFSFEVRPYSLEQDKYEVYGVGDLGGFNVDKYGFRVPSFALPGDLIFGLDEKQDERKALDALHDELDELELNLRRTPDDHEFIHQEMKWVQKDMDRYRQRRENEDPSFKYFLYLSVSNGKQNKTERMEYHQNHHIGMKYLLEKLFGGRPGAIKVKNLALVANNDVLRLPEMLNISVKNLTVEGNTYGLKILQPILGNLTSLDSVGVDRVHNSDYDILSCVKNVILTKLPQEGTIEQVNHKLSHHRVICNNFNYGQLIAVVDYWQRKPPKIGTKFVFMCTDYRDKKEIERIAREEGADIGEVSDTRFGPSNLCVIFPLNDESELTISMPDWQPPRKKSIVNGQHSHHHSVQLTDSYDRFVMRVRRRGTATRFETRNNLDGDNFLLLCIILHSIFVAE